MVRWLSVLLALSLIGSPAAAQTAKKKPAKTETKADKKPRPEPRDEDEPEVDEDEDEDEDEEPRPKRKKKKKKRKAKKPKPKDDEDEEPAESKPAPADGDAGDRGLHAPGKTNLGAGLLLGPALSTSNSDKKLTPLPFLSVSFVIDRAISPKLYFRLEPSFGYLRRRSTVNVVRRVDASNFPDVKISTQDIVNKVNAFDFSLRAALGVDHSKNLTSRVGGLVGFGTAATGAEECSEDNRSNGLVYGLHLTPIAYRSPAGGSRFFEVGLAAELRSQTIPRCDVPLKGEFNVNAGEIANFRPKRVESQFTSVAVALQGALFF
jgi:hypothetical protein